MVLSTSKPESVNLAVALTERYFYVAIVFQKYGIPFPVDAPWKKMDKIPSLNGHIRILQEVPNMLFEIADLFKNIRVEELIKKCETLCLNIGNLYNQFTKTISVLLDNGLTWGKIVVFFSFAVSFAIYLCTNEISDLAGRLCVWAAQDVQEFQNIIQPWIDVNGGWVSNHDIYALFHYLPIIGSLIQYCNKILSYTGICIATAWRETLEGENFGKMARKTSLAE